MIFSRTLITALCVSLLPCALPAQDDKSAEGSSGEGRRWLVGARLEGFASSLFTGQTVTAHTTSPIADYTYTGSSKSPRVSLGPSFEYRLSDHLTVGAEFRFHHAEYKQITQMRSGLVDPTLASDTRPVSTYTENTKINYYEAPLLLHYYLRSPEPLKRVYVSAGVEYRHVGRVRTGTEFVYADGSTDYNEIPATPLRTNQLGLVAGVGLRYVTRFKLRIEPELRFINWQGATFREAAIRSAVNQVEFGFGFSF